MAICVERNKDESIDSMLKRFKRKCKKEGIILEMNERRYFVKPCEKRNKARRIAKLRTKEENENLDN